jgi:hypothetical protein
LLYWYKKKKVQILTQEDAALRKGIEQDDIIWHANALNSFLELYDAPLFDLSLQLKDALNTEFAKEHGMLCAKQTDVPGLYVCVCVCVCVVCVVYVVCVCV